MQASKIKAKEDALSALPENVEKNHFPSDFVKGNYKKYLLPLAVYLAIALIVFWPVTLNITTIVASGGPDSLKAGTGDLYQNLWSLWWAGYAVFNLHSSPYFTNLLFYPTGANLATETLSPLAGIFSYVFQNISLAFGYNVVFFLGFTLSGFFTFLLADYVFMHKYGAFIAGIVFAYGALHMAHALTGHLNWISIEFLPLFILLFLLLIKEKKLFLILGTSISFLLLVFFGDPQQGIMGLLLASLLLIPKLLSPDDRREILNKKVFVYIGSSLLLAFIIGVPFFIPIISGISHGALHEAQAASGVINNMAWSSPLLSFFLPSPYNNFFSNIAKSYLSIYVVDPGERVSYIGFTVLLLTLIGVASDLKKKQFRRVLVWLFPSLIFAWLAVGPYLQIGALPGMINPKTLLPGLYLIYRDIPILNLIREPARFDIPFTLCLSVLAGLGFKEIAERVAAKTQSSEWGPVKYYALFVTLLILAECSGIPLTSSYINSYFLNLSIPRSYYQMSNVTGNFSVVVLPILLSQTNRPNLYTGLSMYYQTAFKKPIVGGYTTRENATDQYIRLNMPLSVAAASLQAGGQFSYVSPIIENYTNVTLFFLSQYRTGFVSVINQAFTPSELIPIDHYMSATFGSPYYTDNLTSIWSVNSTAQKAKGKSIVAYISQGNWTYGCASLGPVFCNSTLNTLWYGPNLRAINVSVPENKTNLLMSFTTASLNKNVTLYLFLTSDKHELGAAKLTRDPTAYSLNLTLSPGTSTLFFVAQNVTNPVVDQIFDVGIKNITFEVLPHH